MTTYKCPNTGLVCRDVECGECKVIVKAYEYADQSGWFYEEHENGNYKRCWMSHHDLPSITLADCNAALDRVLALLEAP